MKQYVYASVQLEPQDQPEIIATLDDLGKEGYHIVGIADGQIYMEKELTCAS